ncbi:MAG TPA: polysaccharide deacetylase family protein [Azospirillaceae bacterium]|nr:polysaccharide deacetylase family protein [Azospirillaceae bacterium]
MTLIDPARHALVPMRVAAPTAVLSIDVEPDYNGTGEAALDRLPELLAVVAELGVPLTAFVEGRVLERRGDLVAALAAAGADVQLHCYDHRKPGDDPADLARGVRAYEAALGRRPEGYRAHTFRLTEDLYAALLAEGFRWDSSVLPGRGLGANAAAGWRAGDWFRLDGRIAEYPVATFGALGIPFTQSYRLLMPGPAEAMLRAAVRLPRLLVYDMHMVDLVRATGSLAASPLPPLLKAAYRASWRFGRRDSFGLLRATVADLRRRGYRFAGLSALHRDLSSGMGIAA